MCAPCIHYDCSMDWLERAACLSMNSQVKNASHFRSQKCARRNADESHLNHAVRNTESTNWTSESVYRARINSTFRKYLNYTRLWVNRQNLFMYNPMVVFAATVRILHAPNSHPFVKSDFCRWFAFHFRIISQHFEMIPWYRRLWGRRKLKHLAHCHWHCHCALCIGHESCVLYVPFVDNHSDTREAVLAWRCNFKRQKKKTNK